MGEVSDAVHNIGEVAQATGPSSPHPYEGIGELAAALDEFDVRFVVECKLWFMRADHRLQNVFPFIKLFLKFSLYNSLLNM